MCANNVIISNKQCKDLIAVNVYITQANSSLPYYMQFSLFWLFAKMSGDFFFFSNSEWRENFRWMSQNYSWSCVNNTASIYVQALVIKLFTWLYCDYLLRLWA